MPLPLVLGIAAAVAGVVGVGTGISGAADMMDASDTMKLAESKHKRNLEKFENQSRKTNGDMDNLGSLELEILKSFESFSEVFEKIKNKPEFKEYHRNGVKLPKYDGEELKKVSVGAGVLLGGIGGAALGTAGGFAAAGATTVAVMALGTASTGTAIASLSGAAATNATLAALGGGAIAAGGGGIALGTTILGAATLGVGLLVGGIIFNFTGSSLSSKADEAWSQMKRAEKEINQVCAYMEQLSNVAIDYRKSLESVYFFYQEHVKRLQNIVYDMKKTDYNTFNREEKLCTENSVLLVALLYKICKVQLVKKAEKEDEMNEINVNEVNESMEEANTFLTTLF